MGHQHAPKTTQLRLLREPEAEMKLSKFRGLFRLCLYLKGVNWTFSIKKYLYLCFVSHEI